MVHEIAQHVDLELVDVRVDFDARDEFRVNAARLGERLLDPGRRVVVGEREDPDAVLARRDDKPRGREQAVRRGAVGVEIDVQRAVVTSGTR
jgi:hypothetical protein